MKPFDKFICVKLIPIMKDQARYHARRRTREIVRRFIPDNAPLSDIESNYVGALGEVAVRYLFSGEIDLEDRYARHKVDSGDIVINGKAYDIKSEAIPEKFYRRLYDGSIRDYEPYGCRVWTAAHLKHLNKYNGGIIFTAVAVPGDAKRDREKGILRPRIVEFIEELLVVGYVEPKAFKSKEPTWYAPEDPRTHRRRKYNSLNYIFYHSELKSVKHLSPE